jgi:hypothetical protein
MPGLSTMLSSDQLMSVGCRVACAATHMWRTRCRTLRLRGAEARFACSDGDGVGFDGQSHSAGHRIELQFTENVIAAKVDDGPKWTVVQLMLRPNSQTLGERCHVNVHSWRTATRLPSQMRGWSQSAIIMRYT